MENIAQFINDYLTGVIIISAAFLAFILLFVAAVNNKTILAERGLPDEYIALVRRQKIRWAIWGIFVLITELILLTSVFLLLGYVVDTNFYYWKIFIPSISVFYIFVVSPGPIFKKSAEEFKELAKKTKSNIIFDFKYRALKLIFNWKIELIATLFIICLNVWFKLHDPVLYLYAFIPWVLIVTLKRSKFYHVVATIRLYYLEMCGAMLVLQALRCLLIAYVLYKNSSFILEASGFADIILIVVLSMSAVASFLHVSVNYKKLKNMFGEFPEETPGDLITS